MADEELVFETVARQASLIERREVSPVALVEAYLDRIDRLNDRAARLHHRLPGIGPGRGANGRARRSRAAGIGGRFMGFPSA